MAGVEVWLVSCLLQSKFRPSACGQIEAGIPDSLGSSGHASPAQLGMV